MDVAIAVDVGGTKTSVGLVDADGRVLSQRRTATVVADPWPALAALVEEVRNDGSPVAVGVGCGGPMTPGGEAVSPLNIAGWRQFPLRARLAALTNLPVHVDNDAKALALAEGWLGAARGERNFLAMVVSTGVGGGLVIDGHLLDGASGNAGHIGHVIVVASGHRCACGGSGCLEAEASGTAIASITGRPAAEADDSVKRRTGRLVGRAVASASVLLDLPLAVVAGSVALGFGEPFFASAQQEIDRRCRIEFARGCRIVPAGLGDKGPLVGAAAVAWRARHAIAGLT